MPVQHYDDIVHVAGPAPFAQLPAGGDQHRVRQPIKADAMRGRQHLDAGDAGHDVDRDRWAKPLRDPQAAVIERRVAPDEQRNRAAIGQVLGDLLHPDRRDRVMPVGHRLDISGLIRAPGHVELDHSRRAGEQLRTDGPAQVDQVGLGLSLARQQDEVSIVHRPNGGERQMIGIARADADQGQADHAAPAIRWKKLPDTRPRRDPVVATGALVASTTWASGSSG